VRVVLLHGFTQGPGSWADLAERLGGEHDVVTPTLPGHGGAGAVTGTFEEEAAALAEAVGPPPAVWVGYSMGGRMALRVALDRPDLVERLVLLGATAGLADAAERAARCRRDETLASGLERKGLEQFLTGWLNQALFKRLPPEAAGMEERRRNTVEGLASSLRRLGTGAQEPLWDRLGELRMPVLLMAGEHDSTFSALAFRLTAGIGENAGVSFVPGAGHAAHLERPDAFATILERFLAHGFPSSSSSSGDP
jgi:2-succinyl-6-hydroxy-2,4-cyclohexadiene-1-carboxylate synthase